MTSLSGASESDILIQKISESIMKLSLKDIESYMTKYPLWKETKDLGMIGDRQSYEVILHKENILALISTFVMESTGSGLIEADKKSIEDTLAQIDMKGRISYDTKDAHFALFDAIITPLGGSGSTIEITMSESASGFSSKISRGTSEVQLTYTK